MKITIDIDCTPQEARSFFGLPPVEAMNEALVAKMQERLTHYVDATDPEKLLRLWLPGGMPDLAKLQEQFWRHWLAGMGAGQSKPAEAAAPARDAKPRPGRTD